ncbi:MAG: hypothetical protein K2N56_06790 [Oscillospiraceae bacterium]|nr:hypothetical protein [Oscillospiraceae bacterium]
MSETTLKEIMLEVHRREFAEFDNAPEHKFSLRHRINMKLLFMKFERRQRKLREKELSEMNENAGYVPGSSLKQRVTLALIVIILMTLLAGWFIPIRGISEDQINWLRGRYDFHTMKQSVVLAFTDEYGTTQYSYRTTPEYSSFLDDLSDLGVYSEAEMGEIRVRQLPLDTRPGSEETPLLGDIIVIGETAPEGEGPLDSVRKFVARLENMIGFYEERAEDPFRAVKGDAEFAELIRERYLPIPKSFLELLEKLYSDSPDDDVSESQTKNLSVLDKDDRVYLLKIHKL